MRNPISPHGDVLFAGDLTSVFKPYNGEEIKLPSFVEKQPFIESVYNAKFKKDPSGYSVLSADSIATINKRIPADGLMPVQEKGTRPACAIPYQLYADGFFDAGKKAVTIKFTAAKEVFGAAAAGSPFTAYAHTPNDLKVRNYAVSPGDTLTDSWTADDFSNGQYHLSLYGPNGFFRELKGSTNDPSIKVSVEYTRDLKRRDKLTGGIEIIVENAGSQPYTIEITDNAYKVSKLSIVLAGSRTSPQKKNLASGLSKSFGWYDFTVKVKGNETFERRYAGHVETGKSSFTDPHMGGVI